MGRAQRARGHAGGPLLAGAGILWGGAGAAGRMLATTGHLSSWQVAAGRALVGGLVLLLTAWALHRAWLTGRRAWRHVAVMAVLTVAYQASYFGAVAAGSLSLATLVTLGSAPVFVTLVHAVRNKALSSRSLGVLVLALIGLVLLVGQPSTGGDVARVLMLSLVAGAAFAAITLVNAGGVPGADHVTATGVAFLLAGLVLATVSAALPERAIAVTPGSLLWLLVLGVACTAAPYALYFAGLLTTPAPVAALFALLEPLTGTLIAVTVFGETLGGWGWVGAALLLAAVVASTLGTPPVDDAQQPDSSAPSANRG